MKGLFASILILMTASACASTKLYPYCKVVWAFEVRG